MRTNTKPKNNKLVPFTNKYHSKKTTVDGITFDSKRESQRYKELKLLEKVKIITDLELQPKFTLQEKFTDSKGRKIRAINYIADFQYKENGKTIVEDVKGVKTEVFKIKEKLLLKRYPNIDFRIIK